MTRILRRVVTLVALLLLVPQSAGCRDAPGATREQSGPVPGAMRLVRFDVPSLARLGVRCEAAGGATSARALHVPGTVEYDPDHYAEVGTVLEGRVSSVAARLGDKVRKGQVLATLVVPSIADTQAEYLSAAATVTAARQNLRREEDLVARELTTAREVEVARSEAAKAEADLAAVLSKLRALHVSVPETNSVVAAAGTYPLTSPIDGVVVRREAVLGAFLEPQALAFAVADLSELWATLEVFEADLPYLREGSHVDLTADAFPGTVFAGTVAHVDPQIRKDTRALRARVALPNRDGSLRPGMFVRARVQLAAGIARTGVLLPSVSVQPLGEADVVFVEREPGVYEIRPVKVLRRTSDIAEVAEGVSPGECVVTTGAFLLRGEATKQ